MPAEPKQTKPSKRGEANEALLINALVSRQLQGPEAGAESGPCSPGEEAPFGPEPGEVEAERSVTEPGAETRARG